MRQARRWIKIILLSIANGLACFLTIYSLAYLFLTALPTLREAIGMIVVFTLLSAVAFYLRLSPRWIVT